jgi:ABC-type glycerol-3-phosphate transport system permease component
MSASTLPRRAETRRERRQRERQEEKEEEEEEEARTIPIKMYGLRRGTVTGLTVLCALFAIFTLIPIAWIMINSTKTQSNIFETFGFSFARPFEFSATSLTYAKVHLINSIWGMVLPSMVSPVGVYLMKVFV